MKKLSILLILAMLISSLSISFTGCKKDKDGDGDTTEVGAVADDSSKTPYNQAAEDFDGFVLDVLCVQSGQWLMHTDFAPENVTGDRINAVVYNRNQMVEQLYNVEIVAHEDAEYYGLNDKLSQDILSGAPVYDAAYVEGSSVMGATISQGNAHNLYSIPELQLEQSWWSQLIKKEATLGSGKYATLNFIQSNLSLTAFDLTWCVYFNKSLHSSLELENFYDLAKEGEWTLETMQTAAVKAANLNGDDSFAYRADGKAVYGITSYWNGAKALMDGCNVQFVTTDDEGEFIPNINNERFINLSFDMATLLSTEGAFTTGGPAEPGATTMGNASDYKIIFNAGRTLFCVAEVKSSVNDFTTYQGEFGILPLPKYDTQQENYRSWINYLAPVLVIPISTTGDNLHKTARLLDALSFYSDRDVLPEYYDVVLKGRGAKDTESTAMLDLINDTKSFDASIAYDWSRQFSEVLSNQLLNGVTDVSSLIDSYEDLIANQIDKTMSTIFGD